LLAQRGDARVEVVHAPVQRPRPGPVPGGAVAAHEMVEVVEQRAGVAHVAAHGAVGPAHGVRVDTQVEVDQTGHLVDHLARVPQRPEPLLGHARPDHLVVVEADAAGADRAGLGLADVVEERGEADPQLGPGVAHHGDRVREHVLVLVDRVLLELHGVELGQELVGQAGPGEEPQPRRGVECHQQLRELVADALGADDLEPAVQLDDRRDERGVGLEVERGNEAGSAEHPEGIVEEGDLGPERCVETARRQVAAAPERVDQPGLGQLQRHGVDREVASRQIGLQVVGECDLGLAALGAVDLGPERGDLEAHPRDLTPHRAEPLPLEPHVIGPAPHDALGLVGTRAGGDVGVLVGTVEEGVAHGASDEVTRVTGGAKPPGQLLDRRAGIEQRAQPRGNFGHRLILARPGATRAGIRPSGIRQLAPPVRYGHPEPRTEAARCAGSGGE
jgi:hypothetical protein